MTEEGCTLMMVYQFQSAKFKDHKDCICEKVTHSFQGLQDKSQLARF